MEEIACHSGKIHHLLPHRQLHASLVIRPPNSSVQVFFVCQRDAYPCLQVAAMPHEVLAHNSAQVPKLPHRLDELVYGVTNFLETTILEEKMIRIILSMSWDQVKSSINR